MTATLLFGNGFNRVANPGFSWESLITQGSCFSGSNVFDAVPFPLIAEASAAKMGSMIGVRNRDGYKTFREGIKARIDDAKLQPGEVHASFRNLPFDYFITTNYDDCFERSQDNWEEQLTQSRGYRNILQPVGVVEGRPLFHAHGRHKWPRTMCISYEHYMALIGKIRNEFRNGCSPSVSEDDSDDKDASDVRLLEGYLARNGVGECLWPSLFFTSDVYVVGLGLGFSEIDLWWLLSLRAAYYAPEKDRDSGANKIVYYDIDADDSKGDDRLALAKRYMLESLGVLVETVSATNHSEGCKRVCSAIAKDLERSKAKE